MYAPLYFLCSRINTQIVHGWHSKIGTPMEPGGKIWCARSEPPPTTTTPFFTITDVASFETGDLGDGGAHTYHTHGGHVQTIEQSATAYGGVRTGGRGPRGWGLGGKHGFPII